MEVLKQIPIADEEIQTVKKHYLANKGNQISKDFLIYTLHEEEQNIRRLGDEKQLSPSRFPLSQDLEEKNSIDESEKSKDIETLMGELFKWYRENSKTFNLSGTLDYTSFAQFSFPFSYFLYDLSLVTELKLGRKIPKMDAQNEESDRYWATLEGLMGQYFPNHKDILWHYFEWQYKQPERREYDLKSIPPIGRFLPLIKRSGITKGQADKKPEKDECNEAEVKALTEVDKALADLKNDTEKQELQLNPQNSFLRRKQHKKIVDAGFESESCGEGADRAVKIIRPTPKEPQEQE